MTDNKLTRILVNKIENRITFRVKTGYYIELLMPETMKLRESTESKITKYQNGDEVPHLKITGAALVHCNIVNNDYQKDSRVPVYICSLYLVLCIWSCIYYF